MLSNLLPLFMAYNICAIWAIPSRVALQMRSNQMIQPLRLPNTTEIHLPTNVSTTTRLQGKRFVECNSVEYGDNLLVADCREAVGYVPFNADQHAFAERDTPEGAGITVDLPFRLMGSECPLF